MHKYKILRLINAYAYFALILIIASLSVLASPIAYFVLELYKACIKAGIKTADDFRYFIELIRAEIGDLRKLK